MTVWASPPSAWANRPRDGARFGIGVTNLYYQDPVSEKVGPFGLEHVAVAAGLAQALPRFDLLSTPGIAQDISQNSADLHTSLHMMAHTIKPLLLLVSKEHCFAPLLDMLEHLRADLAEKPFAAIYVKPHLTPGAQ